MSRKGEVKAAKKAAYEARATELTGVDLIFKNNGKPLDSKFQNALGTICFELYRKLSTLNLIRNVKTSTTLRNHPIYPDNGTVVIKLRWTPKSATAQQLAKASSCNEAMAESLARVLREDGIANLEYLGSGFHLKSYGFDAFVQSVDAEIAAQTAA